MFTIEQIKDLTTITGGKLAAADSIQALKFCRDITLHHYENFPVASFLLPRKIRDHIFPIYTFARIADDIADEIQEIDKSVKLDLLNNYRSNFISFGQNAGNPVFLSLHKTIAELSHPLEPFLKLLEAFRRDIEFELPKTNEDNIEYCSYSANPVGELILRLFGEYNELNAKYSDDICTALQLTNFWQDISNDRIKGRCYIPIQVMHKYNLNTAMYFGNYDKSNFADCLTELFDHTEKRFESGRRLIPLIKSFRLRLELKMTILGGEKILKKCRKAGPRLFDFRPKLSKFDFFIIFVSSIYFKCH